jgi:hypothetical protein
MSALSESSTRIESWIAGLLDGRRRNGQPHVAPARRSPREVEREAMDRLYGESSGRVEIKPADAERRR